MSSAAEPEVLLETRGNKGLITLNRPKALNSLNLNMIRQIYPQMKAWEDDSSVSMVIMKGSGPKAFCAGGDVVEITKAAKQGLPLSEQFFKEEYILNNTIGTYRIPYVALIDGITMGGGVGLSVHGEYRIATERTVFAMPETGIGLFPDVGGGYFLPRLGGRLGTYLALTGFRLKGRDVQLAGVATHYVSSDKVPQLEEDLLNLSDANPKNIAKLIKDYHDSEVGSAQEFVLKPHMEQIDRLFKGNTVSEIMADLHTDGSEWATKQLSTLRKMSPTSMCVTLRQLQQGGRMSLQDVFQMEYRLSQRCMADHDFHEGIRALLIEKDQSPKWKPGTVEEVTQDKLEWYFSPLDADKDLVL